MSIDKEVIGCFSGGNKSIIYVRTARVGMPPLEVSGNLKFGQATEKGLNNLLLLKHKLSA